MAVDEEPSVTVSAAIIGLVLIYNYYSQSRGRQAAPKGATAVRKRKLSGAAPLEATKRRVQSRSRQRDAAEQGTSGGNSEAAEGSLVIQVCHHPLM